MRDPRLFKQYARSLRDREGVTDQKRQNALAGKEHENYAKMRVREAPILGPIEQLAAIPAYTLAKTFGFKQGRSEPSVGELASGYNGMWQGIGDNIGDLMTADPIAKPGMTPPMSQQMTPEQLQRYLGRQQLAAVLKGSAK